MGKFSIFACESHPLMIEGLLRVCDSSPDLYLCGTAPNWPAARIGVARFQPAVVLIDNAAGYRQSALFLAELRTISPRSAAVLWVSDLGETELIRSLQAGARGVIRRNQTVALFCECLRQVVAGQVWIEPELSGIWAEQSRLGHPALTPRERDVVQLVTRGLKNREIAAELGITPGTVKVHLMHVFEKTSAKDRFELALQATRILGTRQETEINSLARRQSA
jgi:two-component system, NarL family, nitrate/nitrite response regulator NarL